VKHTGKPSAGSLHTGLTRRAQETSLRFGN
jgi:hypothetical protein